MEDAPTEVARRRLRISCLALCAGLAIVWMLHGCRPLPGVDGPSSDAAGAGAAVGSKDSQEPGIETGIALTDVGTNRADLSVQSDGTDDGVAADLPAPMTGDAVPVAGLPMDATADCASPDTTIPAADGSTKDGAAADADNPTAAAQACQVTADCADKPCLLKTCSGSKVCNYTTLVYQTKPMEALDSVSVLGSGAMVAVTHPYGVGPKPLYLRVISQNGQETSSLTFADEFAVNVKCNSAALAAEEFGSSDELMIAANNEFLGSATCGSYCKRVKYANGVLSSAGAFASTAGCAQYRLPGPDSSIITLIDAGIQQMLPSGKVVTYSSAATIPRSRSALLSGGIVLDLGYFIPGNYKPINKFLLEWSKQGVLIGEFGPIDSTDDAIVDNLNHGPFLSIEYGSKSDTAYALMGHGKVSGKLTIVECVDVGKCAQWPPVELPTGEEVIAIRANQGALILATLTHDTNEMLPYSFDMRLIKLVKGKAPQVLFAMNVPTVSTQTVDLKIVGECAVVGLAKLTPFPDTTSWGEVHRVPIL